MQPIFTFLHYTYKKPDADVSIFNFDDLPIAQDKVEDRQFVFFGPGSIGGNHKHPRVEWFLTLQSGLELFWLDENNDLQHRSMNPEEGKFCFVEVPSMIPHAVKNMTNNQTICIFELADRKQTDVQKAQIIF